MITITCIDKMTKTITMIKVRLGEMLIALLLGEFLHRLVLIFEELPHVKERWDKKTKYQNTKYQNTCISLLRRREVLSGFNPINNAIYLFLLRYNGRKEEMFWAVFSNCHNQVG